MKIAFTGTHRAGKTTLAETIAESLPGYDLIPEPYLQLQEMGYEFSEIPTIDDYMEQFRYSLKQLKERKGNIIFDRCPLDLLAYIHATDNTKNIELLYEEMLDALSRIDLLVFIPIENPDVIGCDNTDLPDLRQEVNSILENWIKDLNGEIVVVSGTLESRKKQVLDRL